VLDDGASDEGFVVVLIANEELNRTKELNN
jgi:hypothetical protein